MLNASPCDGRVADKRRLSSIVLRQGFAGEHAKPIEVNTVGIYAAINRNQNCLFEEEDREKKRFIEN